jgi:phage-related minor tail protein
MDIDRAMRNPASTFGTPEALSESSELTAEQKCRVLLQWKDQLQQLQAADDEGMQQNDAAAGTTDDMLGRVTSLLSRIDADLKRVPNSG